VIFNTTIAINFKPVLSLIVLDEPTITREEADRLIEEAKEDYQRDYLEEGKRFKLITEHYSQFALAKMLGISRSYIRQRLEIYDNLIPEAKEALEKEKIKFTQALLLSRCHDEEAQRTQLKQLLADREKTLEEQMKREGKLFRKFKGSAYDSLLHEYVVTTNDKEFSDDSIMLVLCEDKTVKTLIQGLRNRIAQKDFPVKATTVNNQVYLERTDKKKKADSEVEKDEQ